MIHFYTGDGFLGGFLDVFGCQAKSVHLEDSAAE